MANLNERNERRVFYVTGLPRSRTAWLSVALSDYTRVACLHEPLAWLDEYTPEALLKLLDATRCPTAGVADSGLPVVAPDLPSLLPGPVLIVWRDPEQVITSLARYLGGDESVHAGGVAAMHARLDGFRHRYEHMTVRFEDLGSLEVMRSVWQHLIPHLPFQRRRIESLMRMRIDVDPARLLEEATEAAKTAAQTALAGSSEPDHRSVESISGSPGDGRESRLDLDV